MFLCVWVRVCANLSDCVCMCVRVCGWLCVYEHVSLFVCSQVSACVFI